MLVVLHESVANFVYVIFIIINSIVEQCLVEKNDQIHKLISQNIYSVCLCLILCDIGVSVCVIDASNHSFN